MADGYQVDVSALTDAASAATEIATLTRPLPKELAAALDDLSGGAAGSQSAAIASSAAQHWTGTLTNHADQIQAIGDKLKQTADDYLRQEETSARTIDNIKPTTQPDQLSNGRISAVLDGL
jgi:uncharacterized protein YukE